MMAVFCGVTALAGHIWPVYLNFRGGKGVATAFGIMLAMSWTVAFICIAIWVLVIILSRYSSLGALIAVLATPPLAYWLATPQIAEFSILLTTIVWSRHLANIRRLLNGTETRVGG